MGPRRRTPRLHRELPSTPRLEILDAGQLQIIWNEIEQGKWRILRLESPEGGHVVIAARTAPASRRVGLTPRETTVLAKLTRGATYKSIAFELGVSLSTVATLATRAQRKLGVTGRVQLVQYLQSGSFGRPRG